MRALLIVDIQRDFVEGGALAVPGGDDVAQGVAQLLEERTGTYPMVFTSRDVHNPLPDTNGGHFAEPGTDPDYLGTWPVHCVRNTRGAELHPALLGPLRERLGRWTGITKGIGRPDYSAFQGTAAHHPGVTLADLFSRKNVTELDIVGLATDYCVYQSALDALRLPRLAEVRVLTDLCAGVAPGTVASSLADLERMGAKLAVTARV